MGGLVGVALIGVALFFFMRARARRRHTPASAEFMYIPNATFERMGTPSSVSNGELMMYEPMAV